MNKKFTAYLALSIGIIFSCSRDQRNMSASFPTHPKLTPNFMDKTWQHSDQVNSEFSRKATWIFSTNGQFVKTDNFNYLGIEESVVETGK